ncbi:MAG: cation:proton antiporter [Dehalococcoidia bacterium]|nr:cation:proton antiporter [Dehalococcoidia bacterium]
MELQSSFQSLFIISLLAFSIPIAATRLTVVRIPIVVGEIVAGIIVGRSGLDLVALDPSIEFLAAFGFAYLMFLSGLEIDFDLLLARRPKIGRDLFQDPLGLGIVTFVATLVVSFGASILLTWTGLVGNPWLMSLILSTTSVGIVMPILKERKLTRSEWGQAVLVSALVADFATMLLITVVAAFLGGGGSFRFVLVLFLFAAFFLLHRLGLVFARRRSVAKVMVELAHTTAQIRVRGCFALVLAFVALSLQLGAEMILGAFLAGAIVALLAGRESHDLRAKLDAMGYGFFIPIFFIKVGMAFDLPALFDSSAALLAVPALAAAAYFVKIVPGLLFRVRYSWRQSLAAGVLLSSRLSLIVAAAAIGVRLGGHQRSGKRRNHPHRHHHEHSLTASF